MDDETFQMLLGREVLILFLIFFFKLILNIVTEVLGTASLFLFTLTRDDRLQVFFTGLTLESKWFYGFI